MLMTPEQEAIVQHVCSTSNNLVIQAYAGTGKSTTIEMCARHLRPGTRAMALAFNKQAKLDLEKKLVGTSVVAKTLNGLGHAALRKYLGVDPRLDDDKYYKLAKAKYPKEASTIALLINTARLSGLLPDDPVFRYRYGKGLVPDTPDSWLDVALSWEIEDPLDYIPMAREILIEGVLEALKGWIDFTDQVYIPTVFPLSFPPYDLVFGDEVQDWSPLNHALIRKLKCRTVAVGDSFQSIYAFRGAMSGGMEELTRALSADVLPLTTCFRCSKAVVREAQRIRTPALMPWVEAPEGKVSRPERWRLDAILAAAGHPVVLCRNTAPLIDVAYRLMARGTPCRVLGKEIGNALLSTLRKITPKNDSLPISEVVSRIHRWAEQQEAQARIKNKPYLAQRAADRSECLLTLIDSFPYGKLANLGELIQEMKNLFASSRGIQLTTIHQAKGLEWDSVFFLDPARIPSPYAKTTEQLVQEENCRYVGVTRAKSDLYYVEGNNLEG